MFLEITHRKSLETSATKSLDKVKASWQMGLEMKLFIPQHCGIKFLKIVLCCNYLYIREVVLFKGTQVLKCSNNVDFPNVFEPMHTNTLIDYTNFSIFWILCSSSTAVVLLLYLYSLVPSTIQILPKKDFLKNSARQYNFLHVVV